MLPHNYKPNILVSKIDEVSAVCLSNAAISGVDPGFGQGGPSFRGQKLLT